MSLIPMIALGALVWTVINFVKYLAGQRWSAVLSQALVWAAGVVGVFVMGAAQFASGITVGGVGLDKLDGWSKVLYGLFVASVLSAIYQFKEAIDRSDSARTDWPRFLSRRPETRAAASAAAPAEAERLTVPRDWTEEVHHHVVK